MIGMTFMQIISKTRFYKEDDISYQIFKKPNAVATNRSFSIDFSSKAFWKQSDLCFPPVNFKSLQPSFNQGG